MRQQKSIFDNIDWPTVSIYIVMVLFGWLNIFSAVYNEAHPSILDATQNYGKQLMWIAVSALFAIIILIIDGKFYEAFAIPFYVLMIALNIGAIFLSRDVKGAHAWIPLGSFNLQPSEFAKLATALALAKYLSSPYIRIAENKTKIIASFMILLPMAIILLQNDTGSALVFASFLFVLYREGLSQNVLIFGFIAALLFVLSLMVAKVYLIIAIVVVLVLTWFTLRRTWRNFLALTVVGCLAIGLVYSVDYVYNTALQPHQKQRIDVLLGKKTDLKGAGYNVNQSLIAIGSGSITGKGFLQGTQTKFDFVPEQSTDFIFCTVGEEWGFIGTSSVLLLFTVLLYRIIIIAERQKNAFVRVYGYGVASILFFHVFINVGMAIGLLPVIGIPFPFFSYGGSSLISFTLLLFILIKLDSYRMYVLR
ncbi:MAG: rod shape-determining protein RodA [Bacteroidia bacterium]|nr:rod shape-determining protein RodA [Bacteroidia bacterium]HQV00047.1 rod shape-determining protein RodA [Bacteroidia bacterium]